MNDERLLRARPHYKVGIWTGGQCSTCQYFAQQSVTQHQWHLSDLACKINICTANTLWPSGSDCFVCCLSNTWYSQAFWSHNLTWEAVSPLAMQHLYSGLPLLVSLSDYKWLQPSVKISCYLSMHGQVKFQQNSTQAAKWCKVSDIFCLMNTVMLYISMSWAVVRRVLQPPCRKPAIHIPIPTSDLHNRTFWTNSVSKANPGHASFMASLTQLLFLQSKKSAPVREQSLPRYDSAPYEPNRQNPTGNQSSVMVSQTYKIPEYRIPERNEEEQLPEMIPQPVDAEPFRFSDAKRRESDKVTDAHELVREYANVRRAASKPHEAVRILRTILVQVSARSISLGHSSILQWQLPIAVYSSNLSTTFKFALCCLSIPRSSNLWSTWKLIFTEESSRSLSQ